VVNLYFGAMVACIEAHGGDVIKFAGDALIVDWSLPGVVAPDTAARAGLAAHAGRCALALARLVPPRPAGMAGELALHTAIACGTVAAMHVGGVSKRYEFFITGHTVRASRNSTQLQALSPAGHLPSIALHNLSFHAPLTSTLSSL